MTLIEMLLLALAVSFSAGVTFFAWWKMPNPAGVQPDLEQISKLMASADHEELSRAIEQKD